MKVKLTYLFTCLIGFSVLSQESIQISGEFNSRAFMASSENPFWFYTNTNGSNSNDTSIGLSAFALADYYNKSGNNKLFSVGAGFYARDGFTRKFERSELFVEHTNKWFEVVLGAKNVDEIKYGLSSINGNILFTGNTRAIPGILISNTKKINLSNWLAVKGSIGHYRLNDNRMTIRTNIHYKSLDLLWQFSPTMTLKTGLQHYVQWGGISQDGIEYPNNFNAFKEVFLGKSSSESDNPNETLNALGNHIGSYQATFTKFIDSNQEVEVYHQSIFEDRSGRELNNFPDGIWGMSYTNKNSKWLRSILYEYVQTVSQSGRPDPTNTTFGQQSGGDNYFSNSIYRSGWTYEGVIIGLPFINPIDSDSNPKNNRVYVHHLGVYATHEFFDVKAKLSLVKNLGTYGAPIQPRENLIYSSLNISYNNEKFGILNLMIGGDFGNRNLFGIGLGYSLHL